MAERKVPTEITNFYGEHIIKELLEDTTEKTDIKESDLMHEERSLEEIANSGEGDFINLSYHVSNPEQPHHHNMPRKNNYKP